MTRASPSTCPGRTGGRATTCTPPAGCGPRRRPGRAEFEGQVQWSGELGYGVRSPEGGQSGHRDDAATGSRQLRDTLERHLLPGDLPAAKRGPRGAIGRMLEKAERFAPGAGKKHREQGRRRLRRRRGGRQLRAGRAGTGAPALPPAPARPTPTGTARLMVGAARSDAGRGDDHQPPVVGRRGDLRGGGRHRPGRRRRGGGGPQPGALRPDAGDDPVRGGRALRAPAGPASWPPCR